MTAHERVFPARLFQGLHFAARPRRPRGLLETLEVGEGRARLGERTHFADPGRLSRKGEPGSIHSQTPEGTGPGFVRDRHFESPGRLSRKGGPGSIHSQTQPHSLVWPFLAAFVGPGFGWFQACSRPRAAKISVYLQIAYLCSTRRVAGGGRVILDRPACCRSQLELAC